MMINPICASAPTVPQEPSPYQPSSRLFRSPLYLRIEEIPGADDRQLEELARAGRALNAQRRIDRDRVFELKMEALRRIWSPSRQDDPGLQGFVDQGGENLKCYATYCVLAEKFGANWRQWDSDFRRPDAPAVARIRRAHAEGIAFHQWIQWQLDEQMGRAAQELPLLTDLPIGSAPTGADAWMWQDALAIDASMGAPPDRYNPHGQDWGAAPFVPHCLRRSGFEPLIAVIRATMRHAWGLRIDHVMGLFRQYWIPHGMPPDQGAFVHYPWQEILGILALESHRNGVWVAGEDLGTVEPQVRQELASQNILSHRLLWFEDDPPSQFPRWTLAAATTHDLSTIAGAWTGSDSEDERLLGRRPRQEYIQQIRDRLQRAVKLGPDAPLDQVIVAAHRALARAPSAVLVANLTDALAVAERLNMPGQSPWPNWSLALPLSVEDLQIAELPRQVSQAMQR
jgi:4-alpha-glucanotransferase